MTNLQNDIFNDLTKPHINNEILEIISSNMYYYISRENKILCANHMWINNFQNKLINDCYSDKKFKKYLNQYNNGMENNNVKIYYYLTNKIKNIEENNIKKSVDQLINSLVKHTYKCMLNICENIEEYLNPLEYNDITMDRLISKIKKDPTILLKDAKLTYTDLVKGYKKGYLKSYRIVTYDNSDKWYKDIDEEYELYSFQNKVNVNDVLDTEGNLVNNFEEYLLPLKKVIDEQKLFKAFIEPALYCYEYKINHYHYEINH